MALWELDVLFMTLEKALSEGGDESLQWSSDPRRPCGITLGYKNRAVGTEAIKLQRFKESIM